MTSPAVWTWSCAGACAVLAAFGLLLLFNNSQPKFLVNPYSSTAESDTANVAAELDLPQIKSSPRTPPYNCKDLGLTEEKVVQAEQMYHILPTVGDTTCRSKYEHQCFRHNSPSIPPTFLLAMHTYEEYHAKCTQDINITVLGVAGDVPDGCKYLVWKAMDGMGNQLLSLVSAYIYSLLTERVMLIATDSHIESYLCNPFSMSSWLLPQDFPEPQLRGEAKRVFTYVNETITERNGPIPKHLQIFITCCDDRRDHPFFCPASQKLFAAVNWVFYHSHEYTVAGLYLIPEFRMKLHHLFPNHDAFMHVSRYLLNPNNEIWDKILKFHKTHMDGIKKQIGIQPRAWDGQYNPSISNQILRCALDQMLLPKPQEVNNTSPPTTLDPTNIAFATQKMKPDISVFVPSLRAEYYRHLAAEYSAWNGANGVLYVSVVTASSEGSQKTGDVAHDRTAIVDMWLLSFMHDMVITPRSTFGTVASGLAGIVPLLFCAYGQDRVQEPACMRSNVAGPCFLVYPSDLVCGLDSPSYSITNPATMVPEVKFCTYNEGLGIQSTSYIP